MYKYIHIQHVCLHVEKKILRNRGRDYVGFLQIIKSTTTSTIHVAYYITNNNINTTLSTDRDARTRDLAFICHSFHLYKVLIIYCTSNERTRKTMIILFLFTHNFRRTIAYISYNNSHMV